MKILKPGVLPAKDSRIYFGICDYCGCELECDNLEARIIPGLVEVGKHYVKCPTKECSRLVVVTEVTGDSKLRRAIKRL